MTTVRITCITKSVPNGGHEHITHAGNQAGTWTVEHIIANIDRGIDTFFVFDDSTGRRVDVHVVRPAGRRAYIRTRADGVWTDNLLSLNACPWRAAA